MITTQQVLLTLALAVCALKTVSGCSCASTFEEMVEHAEFAAIAKVTSDETPTVKGNYYEIDKICELRTPFGTDVERAYMTRRKTIPGIKTSCDGPELEKEKLYFIMGRLHDTDNPDVDSIAYDGCGGFVTQWHSQMNSATRLTLTSLLPFEDCSIEDS